MFQKVHSLNKKGFVDSNNNDVKALQRSCLHRQIASSGHVGTVHQVAHISIVMGFGQWGARSVHIWLHCLRVIHSIARGIHRCAIWEVADRIAEESTRQWRPRSVWVWSNGLWVVDGVAGPVHWCAVWQVASKACKSATHLNKIPHTNTPHVIEFFEMTSHLCTSFHQSVEPMEIAGIMKCKDM